MKKYVVILISILMFSIVFGNLIDDVKKHLDEVSKLVIEKNLYWKPEISSVFYRYQEMGVNSLEELMEKWASCRQLPKTLEERFIRYVTRKLTTTDDFLMSSKVIYKPSGDVELPPDFIQVHTPIRDQGVHGTCWAFSTAGSFESALLVQGIADELPEELDLSEQFVAFHNIDWDLAEAQDGFVIQDSNADVGGSMYFSMYNAIRYGIPPEEDFPYSAFDMTDWIQWNPTTDNWDEHLLFSSKTLVLLNYKQMKDYFNMSYEDYTRAIKEMIHEYGALSVMYLVPSYFGYYTEGIYTPVYPVFTGGHAVTLVGWYSLDKVKELGWVDEEATCVRYYDPFAGVYKEATEFWVLKNSWGSDWGWNGYFVVPMISEEEYENETVAEWQIEDWWMYVPVFDFATSHLNWHEADFNNDGKIDNSDFGMITNALGSEDDAYDISIPKDGVVNGEDLARFFMLWNKYKGGL